MVGRLFLCCAVATKDTDQGCVQLFSPLARQEGGGGGGGVAGAAHWCSFFVKMFYVFAFAFVPFPSGTERRQCPPVCYCLDNHRNYPLLLLYFQSIKPSALPHQMGQVKYMG